MKVAVKVTRTEVGTMMLNVAPDVTDEEIKELVDGDTGSWDVELVENNIEKIERL